MHPTGPPPPARCMCFQSFFFLETLLPCSFCCENCQSYLGSGPGSALLGWVTFVKSQCLYFPICEVGMAAARTVPGTCVLQAAGLVSPTCPRLCPQLPGLGCASQLQIHLVSPAPWVAVSVLPLPFCVWFFLAPPSHCLESVPVPLFSTLWPQSTLALTIARQPQWPPEKRPAPRQSVLRSSPHGCRWRCVPAPTQGVNALIGSSIFHKHASVFTVRREVAACSSLYITAPGDLGC